MTEPKKYSFSNFDDVSAVEIPKLDMFIEEFKLLCEMYGIGFQLENYDEHGYVVPVPAKDADYDFLTNHIHEYGGGIPWLDEAEAEYNQRREEQRKRDERQRNKDAAIRERQLYEQLKAKYEKGAHS